MTRPAPDPFLSSLLSAVPVEHRDTVARTLGTVDVLVRHLPADELPRVIAAAWLTFNVMHLWNRGDHDTARVLDKIAGAAVTDVGGRMALVAGLHYDQSRPPYQLIGGQS